MYVVETALSPGIFFDPFKTLEDLGPPTINELSINNNK